MRGRIDSVPRADCQHLLEVPHAVELRGDELHRFPEGACLAVAVSSGAGDEGVFRLRVGPRELLDLTT